MSSDIYPAAIHGLTWTVTKTPTFSTIVQTAPNQYTTRIAQSQNPIWKWQLIYEWLYDNFPSQANNLPYSPYTDLRTLMGFVLAHQGQYKDFLFDDPFDDYVGPRTWKARYDFPPAQIIIDPAGHSQLWSGGQTGFTAPAFNDAGGSVADGSGSWADQGVIAGTAGQALTLVNDGLPTITYYSPLQRNMGGMFLEDVTDLNVSSNPLRVWANGVLKVNGVDYNVIGPGVAIPGYSWMGLVIQWSVVPTGPITAAFNFYFRTRFNTDDQDFEQTMQELWTIGGGRGKNGKGTLELISSRTPQT